jgi:uncharacterized Zn-finger protein
MFRLNWQPPSSWITIAHIGKPTTKITKLLNLIRNSTEVANRIQNIVEQHPQKDYYNESGICQIICLDCPLIYMGQTHRAFSTRYNELTQNLEIITAIHLAY